MHSLLVIVPSLRIALLGIAAIPFIYYSLALLSSLRFFLAGRRAANAAPAAGEFLPPVSILKPVRGLDPDAYANFASFCRLDYPEYEILFCVGDTADPALPVLQRLALDFPATKIRILIGSGRQATNDKCAKLARLTGEAAYEHLVINDSDVRVQPDYLRRMVAPLADPKTGAVTPLYVPTEVNSWVQRLQEAGMLSEFYPGLFVAKELDGVKFALGPTIATRRSYLREFGGYAAIENRPADDLLIGRLIAEQGREVVLLPDAITTVPDYQSLGELFFKRLRWMTVMRHMRPAGHLGLIFTLGLPWTILALILAPSAVIAWSFLGGYLFVRFALTLLVGQFGLRQRGVWLNMLFVPLWDALATTIWLASFTRRTIRWRGQNYAILNGQLVPAHGTAPAAAGAPVER
uniref:Glycosyltransferase n=1 Tax=Acidobacterium capsulatum TaxID=33075 RepID=A0A7V4XTH2_9BACT